MVADDQLLNNGVTCPARTLDCLSETDRNGPAMVILGPLSSTAISHITISTMTVKFPASDSEVFKKEEILEDDKGPGMV